MKMTRENKAPSGFFSHLAELRKRVIRILIAIVLVFGVSAFFAKDIYNFLAAPLENALPQDSHFIAVHPIEAWITYLKTALVCAIFFAFPYILFEAWSFFAPGLYKSEKKHSLIFVTITSALFLCGALFGYFVVFPYAFDYFIRILEGTTIQFLPLMKDYLGFCFRLLVAFGVIFEIPVAVFYLSITGLVSLKTFVSLQKYFILIAFVFSAFLTPPDVVTQVLMGIPIILLYELSLGAAYLVLRKSD